MGPKISIVIPTYEMNGIGLEFLSFSLDKIKSQTYRNFNVIISDDSESNLIERLAGEYSSDFEVKYIKHDRTPSSSSKNVNNGILHSDGDIIKILFQDDYLFHDNSLLDIANNFKVGVDKWLITGSEHSVDGVNHYRPFFPRYNNKIHLGENTISSPSVLTISNDDPLLFDENLIWLMDCDYYKRCYDKFGLPKILNSINVVNRCGAHQVSNTLATEKIKNDEVSYVIEKYGK